VLVIFIDALPGRFADRLPGLASLGTVRELTPGFGYSVNLHAELFLGRRPDEVGFFGEYKLDLESLDIHPDLPSRVLGLAESMLPRSTRLGRLLVAKLAGRSHGYIPFAFRHRFSRAGFYPLTTSGVGSILDEFDWEVCVADRVPAGLGRKDRVALERARGAVARGERHLFVSLCDLDGLFHEYGIEHPVVDRKLRVLDREVTALVSRYRARYPDEGFAVISDHGIQRCVGHVDLGLPRLMRRFPRVTFFADSLYLSVWSNDPGELERAREEIGSIRQLRFVDVPERGAYGIASRAFGDLLYVADEGYAIHPNFFGFRRSKAYHGYHPEHPMSRGLLVTNLEVGEAPGHTEVHGMLRAARGGK